MISWFSWFMKLMISSKPGGLECCADSNFSCPETLHLCGKANKPAWHAQLFCAASFEPCLWKWSRIVCRRTSQSVLQPLQEMLLWGDCTFVIGSIILFRYQIQNKISIYSLVHPHLFNVSRVHVRGEVTLRGLEGTEATLKGVGFILDYCLLWHSIEKFDLLYCPTWTEMQLEKVASECFVSAMCFTALVLFLNFNWQLNITITKPRLFLSRKD